MNQDQMFKELVAAMRVVTGRPEAIEETESVAEVTARLGFGTDEWNDVQIELRTSLGCYFLDEVWPSLESTSTLAELAAELSRQVS